MTICYTDRTINGNMTITQILDVSGNASLNNVTVNSLSGNLIGNVTGYVTGTVSSLSNHNTDDLAQGSNKYYSDTLVNTLLGNTNSSGGGVSYNNGVFSIGQAIRPDNSPTFKGMTLTDITDASYGLIDFQHNFGAGSGIYGAPTGKETMAQIQTHLGGPDSNGGEITFHTKANNGALGERLRISDTGTNNSNSNFDNKTLLAMNGMLKLERNDAGVTSKDTYIYNSMDSTNVDLNIETRTDMGVSFMAEGTTRMRIAEDGNVGIGTTTPTAKLDVSGNLTVTGTITATDQHVDKVLSITGYSDVIAGNPLRDHSAYLYNRVNDPNDVDFFISTYSFLQDQGITFATQNDGKMRITKAGDVGIGTRTPSAKLDVNGSIKGGATTVSSLTTNTINSDGNQEIQVNADLACNSSFRTTKISPRTGTVIDVDAGLDVEGPIVSESKNNVIPGLYFGTAGFSAGLIQQETISVGTSWVNVPHTNRRGAYLILASGIANDDSALVAAVSDDSKYDVGHINILTRHGDYATNYYLRLQYPIDSNVQIRMNAGNTRDVSIVVIRAGGT
jgi:hypothetical protein